jgi:hypothetical protein
VSILFVVRDGEDKDLPVKDLRLFSNLFFLSILTRFLLNLEKGSDSNAAAVHVLIRYVEAFPTTLYLAHEERKIIWVRLRDSVSAGPSTFSCFRLWPAPNPFGALRVFPKWLSKLVSFVDFSVLFSESWVR